MEHPMEVSALVGIVVRSTDIVAIRWIIVGRGVRRLLGLVRD